MLRVSLKGVWAHKVRLVLTALAIILGTGLITGVYIYTDTIKNAFDQIFVEAYADIDIVISAEAESGPGGGLGYLDEAAVAGVNEVEGVAAVFPNVTGFGVDILNSEGEIVGGGFGPPTFVSNLETPAPDTTRIDTDGFILAEGSYPKGLGQVALDRATAEQEGFEIGSSVRLLSNLLG